MGEVAPIAAFQRSGCCTVGTGPYTLNRLYASGVRMTLSFRWLIGAAMPCPWENVIDAPESPAEWPGVAALLAVM